MPVRLRLTGESLRLTGSPRGSRPPLPPPPASVLLATGNNDLLVTHAGEHLVMEKVNG